MKHDKEFKGFMLSILLLLVIFGIPMVYMSIARAEWEPGSDSPFPASKPSISTTGMDVSPNTTATAQSHDLQSRISLAIIDKVGIGASTPADGKALIGTATVDETLYTDVCTQVECDAHFDTTSEHFTMLDEDNMTSNSNTQAVTQQSIKEYVDMEVSGLRFDLYLDESIAGIDPYEIPTYSLSDTDPDVAESSTTTPLLSAGNNQLIFAYSTSTGLPMANIHKGLLDAHLHLEKSGGASQTITAYIKVVHRSTGGTETLLGTSEETGVIASKGGHDIHATVDDYHTIISTDRLVLKVYANVTGGGTGQVILYFGGTVLSHISVSVETETLSSIFVRQDGTTPIILPQATDCSSDTTEGQVCWNTDDETFNVGNDGGVTMFASVPNVVAKTSDYNVLVAEAKRGTIFTNLGETDNEDLQATLLSAVAGYKFTWWVATDMSTYDMVVDVDIGDKIIGVVGGLHDGDKIILDTPAVGEYIQCLAISDAIWICISNAVWSDGG